MPMSASVRPESAITSRARSTIRTRLPMSRTNVSPPRPMAAAWITNCAASGIIMKKRVMSGWVTVTGPPRRICSSNVGTTLPLLPSTLPKRTMTNVVLAREAKARTARSATSLVHPMTLVGFTALSVEISTIASAPTARAASATWRVPTALVSRPSSGFASTIGTSVQCT